MRPFRKRAFVYIASAMDDAVEAARLAEVVRHSGWDVCFGRMGAPGDVNADVHDALLDRAACILAVWSSNAANTAAVKADVMDGHERDKAVLACLDDAAPPPIPIKRVAFQQWSADGDARAIHELVGELERLAGPVGRRLGAIVPYAPPRRSNAAPAYLLTAAASSAATLAACLTWVSLNPSGEKGVVMAEVRLPAGKRLDEAAAVDSAQTTTSIGIRRYAGGSTMQPAAAPIHNVDWLEQAAWSEIENNRDLPSQIDAIADYMIDYPSGVFADEARVLDATQRSVWRHIQSELIEKGFMSDLETSSVSRTRAAAERYERSIGVAPSGMLTTTLLEALEAGKFGVPSVNGGE